MSDEQDPSKTGQQAAGADARGPEKQYLTAETLGEALKGILPGLINPAITSHTKRLAKDFDERLKALTPPARAAEGEAADGEGDEPAKGAKPTKATEAAAAPKPDPQLGELQKQLAALQKKADKAEKDAAAERRQRIEANGYSALGTALRGKVAAGAEALALDVLRARGHVAIDEAGAVRLRLGTKDEPEEGLDLDSGVAAFLKTKEAAFLLPAPNSGAAGGKKLPFAPPARTPAPRQTASPIAAFEQSTGASIDEHL